MQRFREQHWGLHPKIDPEFGPQPSSHKTTLTGDEGEEIDVTLELSDKERVSHYGLNNRATNLFSIKSDRVFWAEATRTSEPDILKRVYEIGHDKDIEGHVPVMLWYKSFELRPITELTGRDFLLAWWETVQCHLALWKNDVYHRDISPSNLMYRIDNGKIVGVLNDFDLASTQQSATGTERTGTVPFMALDLLDDLALQSHITHAYEHDAESFIWALIWTSLRYDDGKPRTHDRPLDAWLRVDAVGCRKEKTDFLYRKAGRQALVPGKGHEENWKLGNKCLGALRTNMARVESLLEGQDPLLEIDTAFARYLSDPVGPFLEVPAILSPSREPGGGPGEETSQVVDRVSPEGAWAEVGTSCSASEEWELVSADTE